MSDNLNNECKVIFWRLSDILTKLNDTVVEECINFSDEWRFDFVEELRSMKEETIREFEYQRPKIMTNEMKCIFIGDTSGGKSTLINAILGQDDLPMGTGQVTNSFVEIRRSQYNQSFIRINNEEKNVDSLKDLITCTSETKLKAGSNVDLFYKPEECSFLQDNMVLIDIPGIDTDEKIDESILCNCQEADLIVLIVNATGTINNNMRKFVKKITTKFSNLNFILVYNHLDQMDKDNDSDKKRKLLQETANKFFTDDLNKSSEYGKDRTFNLSALEELTSKNISGKNDKQILRSKEFSRFKEALTREMRVKQFRRSVGYLNELFKILRSILDECGRVVDQIIKRIPEASKNFTSKLKANKNLESEINEQISIILTPLYDKINHAAKRPVAMETNRRKMENIIKNFNEILNNGLTDLKSVIKNKIKRTNDEDLMLIIEKMYFPHYLENNFPRINVTQETIENIEKQNILKFSERAEAQEADSSEAEEGPGEFGVRLLITILFLPVFAAAGVVTGVVAGALAVVGCVILAPIAAIGHLFGKDIFNIWNLNTELIKNIWETILKATRESYSKFLNEIEEKMTTLFDGNGKKDKLNQLKKEMVSLEQNFIDLKK